MFFQGQDRYGADERLKTDGLLHMQLESCAQDARAVFGTGVGSERGGGGDSAALGWECPNLPD